MVSVLMATSCAQNINRHMSRCMRKINCHLLGRSAQIKRLESTVAQKYYSDETGPDDAFTMSSSVVSSIIFKMFQRYDDEMSVQALHAALTENGISWKTDPRLEHFRTEIANLKEEKRKSDLNTDFCSEEELHGLIADHSSISVISKALSRQCIIPDFTRFEEKIQAIYDTVKQDDSGKLADYIPQLELEDPTRFGIALCTIDGQRMEIGDAEVPFCLQSCMKPFQYAVAITNHTSRFVHSHIGKEPSGNFFNAITLNSEDQPHNPMINAGALVVCSILKPELPVADRYVHVQRVISDMAAKEYTSFHNAVFQSERVTAFRNFALAYLLKEKNVGLPAKSGVSGGLMLVIPNMMGIMIWSPLLDERGNSVRGLQFCKELVRSFNFHIYDNLRFSERKNDPRLSISPLSEIEEELRSVSTRFWSSDMLIS